MTLFSKARAIVGRLAYATSDGKVVANKAFVAGGEQSVGNDGGNIVLPGSPTHVAVFDDFLGDAIDARWTPGVSDTGQTTAAAAALTNGVARLTTSATSTQTPAGGVMCLSGNLNWKANQGELRFATRIKSTALTGVGIFAGFSDTGGAEVAAYDTGGGVFSIAADVCGFLYGGEGGTGVNTWRAVAAKSTANDSGDVLATTGISPTVNVYDVLELAIGKDGQLSTFYINGNKVASLSTSVAPTVALAPTVQVWNTDGAATSLDIDWINVSALRDTGT